MAVPCTRCFALSRRASRAAGGASPKVISAGLPRRASHMLCAPPCPRTAVIPASRAAVVPSKVSDRRADRLPGSPASPAPGAEAAIVLDDASCCGGFCRQPDRPATCVDQVDPHHPPKAVIARVIEFPAHPVVRYCRQPLMFSRSAFRRTP